QLHFILPRRAPEPTLFPYTTLFRSGRPQSIFGVDQSMVEQGRLKQVARENLRLGEEIRLDDGTVVRFDGVERWVNLQVSHDPFQDRKSTRLNSSHVKISYAVFCLKK